jgi:hypothetical protein
MTPKIKFLRQISGQLTEDIQWSKINNALELATHTMNLNYSHALYHDFTRELKLEKTVKILN